MFTFPITQTNLFDWLLLMLPDITSRQQQQQSETNNQKYDQDNNAPKDAINDSFSRIGHDSNPFVPRVVLDQFYGLLERERHPLRCTSGLDGGIPNIGHAKRFAITSRFSVETTYHAIDGGLALFRDFREKYSLLIFQITLYCLNAFGEDLAKLLQGIDSLTLTERDDCTIRILSDPGVDQSAQRQQLFT